MNKTMININKITNNKNDTRKISIKVEGKTLFVSLSCKNGFIVPLRMNLKEEPSNKSTIMIGLGNKIIIASKSKYTVITIDAIGRKEPSEAEAEIEYTYNSIMSNYVFLHMQTKSKAMFADFDLSDELISYYFGSNKRKKLRVLFVPKKL